MMLVAVIVWALAGLGVLYLARLFWTAGERLCGAVVIAALVALVVALVLA